MRKEDFKLLKNIFGAYSKIDLRYSFAQIDFDNKKITVADSKRVIVFYLRDEEIKNCKGVFYTHSKILSLLSTFTAKDYDYSFKDNCLVVKGVSIGLDNLPKGEEFEYPDVDDVIKKHTKDIAKQSPDFKVDTLIDIEFELPKKNVYINTDDLAIFQEHKCYNYNVYIKPQEDNDPSVVKIEGFVKDEYDDVVKRYDAVIMGVIHNIEQD